MHAPLRGASAPLLTLAMLAGSLPALLGAAPPADRADRPRADLTAPTADAPADTAIGGTFDATLAATDDGTFTLQYRAPGEDDFVPFVDPDASGTLVADEPLTVTVDAPAHAGTYDLRLDVRSDDRQRVMDTEVGALHVSGAPEVVLSAPTAEAPALVGPGDPVEVVFTSSTTGTYTVAYRQSALPGTDFVAFPAGTGLATAGQPVTTSVTAPGTPGAFDLQVTVVSAAGQGSDIEDHAVLVARPDLLPSDYCDDLDPRLCLLPFPNDRFTVADPTTTTGRRVNLDVRATPRNVAGKPLDPTEWNRQDGFSPGSMVLSFVPGLDLAQTWGTGVDHIADLARYEQPDAPIVIVDTETGERHPFWSELDHHQQTPDDDRVLILRPAVNFEEGHRYVVALRDLKDASGATIPTGETFAHLRDGTAPAVPDLALEARRAHHERLFTELERAGIARDELYLAWDFTIASADNIAGRVLHMRDDAFGRILNDPNLADGLLPDDSTAPEIVIDYVAEDGGSNARWVVHGAVKVPNYLDRPQRPVELARFDRSGYDVPAVMVPGSRMLYDPVTGDPMQNPADPWMEAPFICAIPTSAVDADDNLTEQAIPALYGHGLLGSRQEGAYWSGGRHMLAEQNTMNCGVDWIGMAEQDLANVASILVDGSNFPSLADRAQQGFLNFLFVGRALVHPDGFAAMKEFQAADGTPVFDTSELFYDGNSQGAIMGGALTSLAPDFTKAVLGVPGMNYSTLLNRSVDWEGELFDPAAPDIPAYSAPFYAAYPDVVERQLMFGLMQMLWDRAESNGYAHHMTDDPYPNTPPHQILLHTAFGDFQVANVAAEVMGRTADAKLLPTALADGRHWALDPTWGFETFSGATDVGDSALIYFDSGNFTPPNSNTPPAHVGDDPHGHPRNDTLGGVQKRAFFDTGIVFDTRDGAVHWTDYCGRGPIACTSTDS